VTALISPVLDSSFPFFFFLDLFSVSTGDFCAFEFFRRQAFSVFFRPRRLPRDSLIFEVARPHLFFPLWFCFCLLVAGVPLFSPPGPFAFFFLGRVSDPFSPINSSFLWFLPHAHGTDFFLSPCPVAQPPIVASILCTTTLQGLCPRADGPLLRGPFARLFFRCAPPFHRQPDCPPARLGAKNGLLRFCFWREPFRGRGRRVVLIYQIFVDASVFSQPIVFFSLPSRPLRIHDRSGVACVFFPPFPGFHRFDPLVFSMPGVKFCSACFLSRVEAPFFFSFLLHGAVLLPPFKLLLMGGRGARLFRPPRLRPSWS